MSIALTINGVSTAEGLYARLRDANFSDTDTECLANSSCYGYTLLEQPARFVFGRLLLNNTYGSEWDALPVSLSAQLYNAERFITNRADNCTLVSYENLELVDPPTTLSTVPMGLPGPIALERGHNQPRSIMLSPPGVAGDVQIRYLAPPWLTVKEPPDENPKAFATFGIYGGHDRVTSWQEIYSR